MEQQTYMCSKCLDKSYFKIELCNLIMNDVYLCDNCLQELVDKSIKYLEEK